MTFIEQKLIDAWVVLILATETTKKTLADVPENLRSEVEITVKIKKAEKTIEILSNTL